MPRRPLRPCCVTHSGYWWPVAGASAAVSALTTTTGVCIDRDVQPEWSSAPADDSSELHTRGSRGVVGVPPADTSAHKEFRQILLTSAHHQSPIFHLGEMVREPEIELSGMGQPSSDDEQESCQQDLDGTMTRESWAMLGELKSVLSARAQV